MEATDICSEEVPTPTPPVQCDKTDTKDGDEEEENVPHGSKAEVKMSGYLEKRSKRLLGWRRYWFVLDGRLLSYYKSKTDYEGLSPLCGSVNLGNATNVCPVKCNKGFPFQIATRSQIYYLRAPSKPELDKWIVTLQEAVTIPPHISSPVWTDPGIQFYRYSFSAVSQWSLETSTEDLTVRKLPQNFYRPSSLLKKCHSFTALNFTGGSKASSLKHAPSRDYLDHLWDSYGTYSSTLDFDRKKKVKEMQETVPRRSSAHNNGKMRHTTSMLVLQSSPEASALRHELGRKLSFQNPANHGRTGSLGRKDDSHYINYQPEDAVHHEYDEINDISSSIYEPCGNNDDAKSSAGESIYENIERSPHTNRIIFEDPWERLPQKNGNAGSSFYRSPPASASSFLEMKRNSKGSGRNSLNSIAELPEKEAPSPARQTLCSYETAEDTASTTTDTAEQMSDCSEPTSITDRKGNKLKLSLINRSNTISTFFHKIFSKNDRYRKEKGRAMVITGPVDLRSRSYGREKSKDDFFGTSKPHAIRPGLKPAVGYNSSDRSSQELMQELNQKIGNMRKSHRSNDSTLPHDTPSNTIPDISTPKQTPHVSPVRSTENDQMTSTEYLKRLDRFNRLSASLNPSFIAALTNQSSQSKSIAPTPGKIGRSHSCRVRSSGEEPPMLPPKRKQVPCPSLYDVPQNNSPVKPSSEERSKAAVIVMTPSLREMTKKHSAPDICLHKTPDTSPTNNNTRSSSVPNTTESVVKEPRKVGSTKRPAPPPPPRPQKKPDVVLHPQPALNCSQSPSEQQKPFELACDESVSTTISEFSTTQTLTQSQDEEQTDETQNQNNVEHSSSVLNDHHEIQDLFTEVVSIIESKLTAPSKAEDAASSSDTEPTPVQQQSTADSVALATDTDRTDHVFDECHPDPIDTARAIQPSPVTISDDTSSDKTDKNESDKVEETSSTTDKFKLDGDAASSEGTDKLESDYDAPSTGEQTDKSESDIQCLADRDNALTKDEESGENQRLPNYNSELELETVHPIETDNVDPEVQPLEFLLGDASESSIITSNTVSSQSQSNSAFVTIEEEREVSENFTGELLLEVLPPPEPADDSIVEDEIRHEVATILPPSPPLSNKSVDIDSLEILSEISTAPPSESSSAPDSPLRKSQDVLISENLLTSNTEIQNHSAEPVRSELSISLPMVVTISSEFSEEKRLEEEEAEDEFDDGSHFYDDVPFESPEELKLNYAAISQNDASIWETVEETEEEVYELYDDFPVDNFPVAQRSTIEMDTSSAVVAKDVLRQSGIDQLQEYLSTEGSISSSSTTGQDSELLSSSTPKNRNKPAVNRLGHSSAISQLKRLATDGSN